MSSTAVENDEDAFLSAVHYLVQRQSQTDEADLLLAAVTHALDGVALDIDQLAARVSRIWPGPLTTKDAIEPALAIGRELGLLVTHDDLNGQAEWMLTQRGGDDVAVHRAWAGEIRRRNTLELANRAESALGMQLGDDEAALWLDALIRALAIGIQHAQDAYAGNIEQLVSGVVRPRGIDRDMVLEAISGSDPSRTEFLRATALAAMDPLDPFGNEIISYITTGCVLHSVVAQSARAQVTNALGGAAGERVFLDTPCLVELLHVPRVSEPMEVAIRAAVGLGWQVQVLQHSIEELREVFARSVETMPESFQNAVADGRRQEWLASLVNDQITSMFVEARQAGLYGSLAEFGRAVDLIEEKLEGLGVVIRPASNDDRAEVTRFANALADSLPDWGGRSRPVINRDAETMAAAARRRRRQRQEKPGSRWPGCWVVTTDRHMGPAFSSVTSQRVTLTLTPSQWTKLLATSSPVTNTLDLAVASANQWIEEAMWAIPVRFPPDTAIALARSLAPEAGGSTTDLRVAQLTLADALDAPDSSDASMAARILERRTKRREETATRRLAAAEAQGESDRRARLQAEKEREAARNAEARALLDASNRSADTEHLKARLAWEKRRSGRIVMSAIAIAVGVATMTVALLTANRLLLVVAATALAAVGYCAYRWCTREDERLIPALVGAAIQSAATVVTLVDYFDLLPKP